MALRIEPSAASPEYLDTVDVLKEQEQQIRELQDEIKSKEEQLGEKRKSLEHHAVAVNKDSAKNKELELDRCGVCKIVSICHYFCIMEQSCIGLPCV